MTIWMNLEAGWLTVQEWKCTFVFVININLPMKFTRPLRHRHRHFDIILKLKLPCNILSYLWHARASVLLFFTPKEFCYTINVLITKFSHWIIRITLWSQSGRDRRLSGQIQHNTLTEYRALKAIKEALSIYFIALQWFPSIKYNKVHVIHR